MPDEQPESGPRRGRRRLETLVLVLVVGLPILVLIGILGGRNWYPTGDLAQAEMRMQSLPKHPPLVGAAGRITDEAGRQGNHPGPLMFWTTWPLYKLLGSSSWAFEAATALVNLAWLAVAVWLVRRRTSVEVSAWFAAVALVLVGGFGLDALSQPWNPWVALLPFLVLVLTAWRSIDGWRWSPVVAVAAASYAIQGHAGYAPVALPLVLVSVLAPLWHWFQTPSGFFGFFGSSGQDDDDGSTRYPISILMITPFVGLALWLGPLWDQLTSDPTNFQKLYENFAHPREAMLGLGDGLSTFLRAASPWGAWVRGGILPSGSIVPGLLLLLAWLGVAIAVRIKHPDARPLLLLDALVAMTLLFGVYAVSRIFGTPFLYVYRWITVLVALVVFTLGWGIALLVPRPPAASLRAIGITALAFLGLLSVFTTVRVGRQDIPYGYTGRLEEQLAPEVAAKLAKGKTYLVDWPAEDVYLGGLGHGLILDLERRGFTVGARPRYAAAVEPHRVLCAGKYDALLEVVSGPHLIEDVSRALHITGDGSKVLARAHADEGFDYEATLRRLRHEMQATGKAYRLADLERRLTTISLLADAPPAAKDLASKLISHGVPSAVLLIDPAPDEPPLAKTPPNEPCWKQD